MAAGFTREQVAHVAMLARLELTEVEIDLFARQLGDILEYANQVQRIDTTGVPPTASVVTAQAPGRADEVVPSIDRRAALGNAPDGEPDRGLFKVPRVIG